MKGQRILNVFLGATILLFGFLKFFSPFRDWYKAQLETSGLPQFLYPVGIGDEIVTGVAFLLPFLLSMNDKSKRSYLTLANSSIIAIMMVATFVHLVPQVPADILPLKIKPPILPLTFMAIAIFNLVRIRKDK